MPTGGFIHSVGVHPWANIDTRNKVTVIYSTFNITDFITHFMTSEMNPEPAHTALRKAPFPTLSSFLDMHCR